MRNLPEEKNPECDRRPQAELSARGRPADQYRKRAGYRKDSRQHRAIGNPSRKVSRS